VRGTKDLSSGMAIVLEGDDACDEVSNGTCGFSERSSLSLRKLGNRRHIRISIALQRPTGGQPWGRQLAYTDVAVLHALRERFAVELDAKDARLMPIRRKLAAAVERDAHRPPVALATHAAMKGAHVRASRNGAETQRDAGCMALGRGAISALYVTCCICQSSTVSIRLSVARRSFGTDTMVQGAQ
jgi:hypothetical protein